MTAIDRLLEIEARFAEAVEKIVPLELDGDALKIVLHLKDGGTLRVVEQWKNARLEKYSYYWLAPDNSLRIGWDNVPHHKHVATFPHHTSRRPTRYDKQATDEVRVESIAWFLHQACRHPGHAAAVRGNIPGGRDVRCARHGKRTFLGARPNENAGSRSGEPCTFSAAWEKPAR